jgi:hypothetical protein
MQYQTINGGIQHCDETHHILPLEHNIPGSGGNQTRSHYHEGRSRTVLHGLLTPLLGLKSPITSGEKNKHKMAAPGWPHADHLPPLLGLESPIRSGGKLK